MSLITITITITIMLRNFRFFWIFIDRAFTAAVRCYYWFMQGDAAEMPASNFLGLVYAMYPFSDEERLCVCNIITNTYLLLRLLLL